MNRSTEMICLREGTFKKVSSTGWYKVFEGTDKIAAIVFDPEAINALKVNLDKLATNKPVHICVFSLSDDTYESDFADLTRAHELRPIPESILEVYRRIFIERSENVGAQDD